MSSLIDPTRVYTHYYKIAHLNTVQYIIYTTNIESSCSNDQTLLELELEIRYAHPDIIITYYNKCLYFFSFSHLHLDYANIMNSYNLEVKASGSVKIETIANPSKLSQDDSPNQKHLPFVSLTFLKAIKKLILFRLSKNQCGQLFGNYALISHTDDIYSKSIIQVDPLLLPSGDILFSSFQRNTLKLYSSDILLNDFRNTHQQNQNHSDIITSLSNAFAQNPNVVIYIIPSGIRCHMYYPDDPKQCFSLKPPKNSASIYRLIKLSTGLDLEQQAQNSESGILWVKLVPNLQHLNNQTSNIAKFIHSIDNRKFIMWPWQLCILQFGHYQPDIDKPSNITHSEEFIDPLQLMQTFIDHKISSYHHMHFINPLSGPNQHQSSHAPLSVSSIGSNGVVPELNNPTSVDLSDNHDTFGLATSEYVTNPDSKLKINSDNTDSLKKDQDIHPSDSDDLFGDDSEYEDSTFINNENDEFIQDPKNQSSTSDNNQKYDLNSIDNGMNIETDFKDKQENDAATEPKSENLDIEMDILKEPEEETKFVENGDKKNSFSSKDNNLKLASTSYINIPKDQMTIAKNFGKYKPTSSYNDPGAPLPTVPTPFVPSFVNSASVSSTVPPSDVEEGSIFSPILFNPIIRSNIDTKYGKGGKFYVEKESHCQSKKNIRATSVSEYSKPNFKVEEYNSSVLEDQDDEMEDFEENGEEESDADEIEEIPRSPPLKLNVASDSFTNKQDISLQPNLTTNGSEVHTGSNGSVIPPWHNNYQSHNEFNSPLFGQANIYNPTFNMTSGLGFSNSSSREQNVSSVSSVEVNYDNSSNSDEEQPTSLNVEKFEHSKIDKTKQENDAITPNNQLDAKKSTSPSAVSESSNCLPLILRCVNVYTIPRYFFLNNLEPEVQSDVNYKIYVNEFDDNDINEDDEDDDDTFNKKSLSIKIDHLNDILPCLSQNLIFDHGLNQFEKSIALKTPIALNDTGCQIDGESKHFDEIFKKLFPLSYKVTLDEFMREPVSEANSDSNDTKGITTKTSSLEADNQLSFLEDITNDETLNPRNQLRKLHNLEWDSIYHTEETNTSNNSEYIDIITSPSKASTLDINKDCIMKLESSKAKVTKGDVTVYLNTVGLHFWKYLKLQPNCEPKNFQLLLICEDSIELKSLNRFLDSLVYSYKDCNLGKVSLVHIGPDKISDPTKFGKGLLTVHSQDYYRQANKRLSMFAEQIRIDLMNKVNTFEFDRPLLLMFLNHNESLNSLLQISKLFKNFKNALHKHQVPLVEVFSYIIPQSYLVKKYPSNSIKYLSNYTYCQIAMNIFNQCPDMVSITKKNSLVAKYKSTYTQLVREPPSANDFKFFNGGKYSNVSADLLGRDAYVGNTYNGELFLHLAYERSIDKNWISAAWSDPLGNTTFTKSWNCSPAFAKCKKDQINHMGKVCEEIWDISNELFKKLNEEIIKEMSGFGGKKFLVLTRINSIIPDDELVYWKKLSIRHKDVSLIVLSVNEKPKMLFESNEELDLETMTDNESDKMNNTELFKNFNSQISDFESVSTSPNFGISVSPYNAVINFHSPQQYNVGNNFLSPQDPDQSKKSHNVPNSSLQTSNNTNNTVNPQGNSSNQNIGINNLNNHHNPNNYNPHAGQTSDGKTNNSQNNNNNNNSNNPNETSSESLSMVDIRDNIYAIMPDVALPSFNSPTRLGMKIGYLVKRIPGANEQQCSYLVYEVNLLSCSNYWKLNSIMKLLLKQYRNLITLNYILGVQQFTTEEEDGDNAQDKFQHAINSLVPWHVAAVSKSLQYLVHIEVKE